MELHRIRGRLGAAVAAIALAGAVAVAAPPAGAVADVTSERVAGVDRFETAGAIAGEAFPTGSSTVVVASGRAFPDALAGAALGLPVLLTEATSLPDATVDAISSLGATTIYLLGGTAAVSAAVEAELEQHGDVLRIGGVDRYETAARLAAAVGTNDVASIEDRPTAVIATGLGFADALAGGPIAAGAPGDGVFPILLVNDEVPPATEQALADLGIEQVIVLGGTAAVPGDVADELETQTGNPVVRLAGTNRFGTAAAIADYAVDSLGFPGVEAILANGIVFADALAAGPLGGIRQAPIILSPASPLAAESEAWFEAHADTIETITTVGGTAAVATSTASAAETAGESEVSEPGQPINEAISVSPQAAADVANGGSREYVVDGLTGPVDIVLIECADITRGTASTSTTFRNVDADIIADGTSRDGAAPDEADVPNAHLSSVNGTDRPSTEPAVTNNDYADAVAPDAEGSVSFTVSGPAADSTASVCVQPVVFVDSNVDNALNVPSGGTAPNEDFGVGGQSAFSPAAAGAGQFGAHNVESVDKTSDRFTGCAIISQLGGNELVDANDCSSFRYDSNDVFQISGDTTTMALWEAALSLEDDVQGTYAAETSGVSTFNLTDEDSSGGAPLIIAAVGNDADGDDLVEDGDLHRLTFSENLAAAAATTGTYTVQDSSLIPTQVTFDCGGDNASCSLSGAVLTVAINETPALPIGFDNPGSDGSLTYPLTITATDGFVDADGKQTNVAGSTDARIEGDTLAEQRPFITAARMTADPSEPGSYGGVGDAMQLTFSEIVALPDGTGISEAEFEAITGRDIAYGAATVVTATGSGSTALTLTITGAPFASGINVNTIVDGSSNSFVIDAAGNPQQANPTADPQLQPIS